jgi:hypothetical protein
MAKPTSTPSLRDLALDAIGAIAATMRPADPSLTKALSIAKAAQTTEGRSAYAVCRLPGAEQPWPEVIAHMAKGEVYVQQSSMRDVLIAKALISVLEAATVFSFWRFPPGPGIFAFSAGHEPRRQMSDRTEGPRPPPAPSDRQHARWPGAGGCAYRRESPC